MKQRKYCFLFNKIIYFVNKPILTQTIFKIAFLIMICSDNIKICKIENNCIFKISKSKTFYEYIIILHLYILQMCLNEI